MADWLIAVGIAAVGVPAAQLDSNQTPTVHGWRAVLFDIGAASIVLMVPCVIASVVSLIVRRRRAAPVERLQLRWVVAAGAIAVGAELLLDGASAVGLHSGDDVQTVVETTAFSLIAVATGIAIRRYRLYEIDRIVSRTLSYAMITVLLAGTYLGIVTLAATVIPDSYGSVGVAAATLAVAALFVPLRHWIQGAVDRRFNRSRYDASRTIDAFAAHIRADLSQSALADELLRTVQRAVAPSSAGIWLLPR